MFTPPQNFATENNQQAENGEAARRQQVMRFALLICMLFLFLDNGNQSQKQPTTSNSNRNDAATEVPLGDQYTTHVSYILQQQTHSMDQRPMNATGLYRGRWDNAAKSTSGSTTTSDDKESSGSVLVQLVSVPVRNLPDVSFVYGLLHLYKDSAGKGGSTGASPLAPSQVNLEAGFPLQGVLISSQQKLVLFSTPYRSQRLYLRIASKHHFGNTAGITSRDTKNNTSSAHGGTARCRRRALTEDAAHSDVLKRTHDNTLAGGHGHEVGEQMRNQGDEGMDTRGHHVQLSQTYALDRELMQYHELPTQLEWDPLNTALSMPPVRVPLEHTDDEHRNERDGVDTDSADAHHSPLLGSRGTGRISAQRQLQGYRHHPVSPLQQLPARLLRSLIGALVPLPEQLPVESVIHPVQHSRTKSTPGRVSQPSAHRRRATSSAAATASMEFNTTDPAGPGALISAWLKAVTAAAAANAVSGEVKLTTLTKHGYLSVQLADQPLRPPSKPSQPQNTTAGAPAAAGSNSSNSTAGSGTGPLPAEDAEFLLSIALGESVLPMRFKALQSVAPPPALRSPTLTVQRQDNSSTVTATASAPTSPVQTQKDLPRLPPMDCQYLVQLSAAPAGTTTAGGDQNNGATLPGFLRLPANLDGDRPPAEGSAGTPPSDPPAARPKKPAPLETVATVNGLVLSDNCGKNISLMATVFDIQLNVLKTKVEHYALAATFVCLIQVFLVVYQMKYSATQALSSRLSYISIFAQSLLDANLCLMHLLLSFAFPTVFFASFIWIAVLKLLLFSVFQMRLIINIYQARFSQELAAEGWQGLRRRLIVLHVRFYGAVLVVLLVSITFYTQPVVAVLAMYSFWVPQIAHSAYYGTKSAFHPVYLLGISVTRCFIPLYILGCPNNFLVLLAVYTNPHYLAGMADAVAHPHTLQSLSVASFGACWVLVLWTAAQVGVLLLQGSLGPRFFVPKHWLPSKYDYHRPIPEHLRAAAESPAPTAAVVRSASPGAAAGGIEMTGIRSRTAFSTAGNSPQGAGRTVGSYAARLQALLGFQNADDATSASAGTGGELGEEDGEDAETGRLLGDRHHDHEHHPSGSAGAATAGDRSRSSELECVICYNPIAQGSFDYMITPCDHVFHEQCLTQWTNVKLECPVCRAVLPAVDED